MNSNIALNIIKIILIVLLQVLILNNINLFGYINPYFYIYFIFIFPIKSDRIQLFTLSFILGIIIDWFSNTGGIHASAMLLIAALRRPILSKIVNKPIADVTSFNIYSLGLGKAIFYIASISFIHSLTIYLLDYFSLQNISIILTRALISSIFTTILLFMGIVIFTKRQ